MSANEPDTAQYCLRSVLATVAQFLDDATVRTWIDRSGAPWETFDEAHETLAGDMDLELWGHLLAPAQLEIYREFLRRLDALYERHPDFPEAAARSEELVALRASARRFLESLDAA